MQLSDVTVSEEESSSIQLDRPAIELLLVFQRTVEAVIFAEYMKMTETQDKEKGDDITCMCVPINVISHRLHGNVNSAWSCSIAGQIH